MTNRRNHVARTVLLALVTGLPLTSFGQVDVSTPDVQLEALGDDRYRIGNIIVDKSAQSFTIDGKILHLDKPLEYLAVKTNGSKGYESLLELETSASEFKLACILVGLDDADSAKPQFQFDESEVEGQAVEITLHWTDDGDAKVVKGANALMNGDKPFDDHSWVYIGSLPSQSDGSLMAEASGTLIGFVHDPLSIIEHRTGAGIGAYGSITGNADLLPPAGSPITMTVSVLAE